MPLLWFRNNICLKIDISNLASIVSVFGLRRKIQDGDRQCCIRNRNEYSSSDDWDADDVVDAFKKFKQKSQLAFKSILKGATTEEQVSFILLWSGERD